MNIIYNKFSFEIWNETKNHILFSIHAKKTTTSTTTTKTRRKIFMHWFSSWNMQKMPGWSFPYISITMKASKFSGDLQIYNQFFFSLFVVCRLFFSILNSIWNCCEKSQLEKQCSCPLLPASQWSTYGFKKKAISAKKCRWWIENFCGKFIIESTNSGILTQTEFYESILRLKHRNN